MRLTGRFAAHPRRWQTVAVLLSVAVGYVVGWLLPPSKLADSTSALVARLTVQQFAAAASLSTATPIKYLVVIFQENQTFDHYFATYPQARNLPDEPPFHADAQPPRVNGLSPSLLTHNPNAQNPFRLDPRHAL